MENEIQSFLGERCREFVFLYKVPDYGDLNLVNFMPQFNPFRRENKGWCFVIGYHTNEKDMMKVIAFGFYLHFSHVFWNRSQFTGCIIIVERESFSSTEKQLVQSDFLH